MRCDTDKEQKNRRDEGVFEVRYSEVESPLVAPMLRP
jgi:hypothetical protein